VHGGGGGVGDWWYQTLVIGVIIKL